MGGKRSKVAGMQQQAARVQSNIKIAPDVFIISFRRPYDFKAGQVIGLTTSGKIEPRLYSIASGEQDEVIEILYNIKSDGLLTPQLASLTAGSTIYVTEPFGEFLGTLEPSFCLASGTGIAPFRSMFRSGYGEKTTLIHGGRFRESFYFQDEFAGPGYIRCISGEKLDGAFQGRLTLYLNQLDKLPPDYKYYICGSAEMVVDVRDILIKKGIAFNQIMAEIYF
jgi:ferredoxin/flavodoxin---NADP+ reductase